MKTKITELSIMEASLNLRVERGKKKEQYKLSKDVAEKQLSFTGTDIYTNVEFMDCQNEEYLNEFKRHGYNEFYSLDKHGRGILCEVSSRYTVRTVAAMSEPHFLHLRIEQNGDYIDLITVRVLVAGSDAKDYKDRRKQWNKVVDYIASLPDISHVVLIGDFNHGVIGDIANYRNKPREYFNFQIIENDLKAKKIALQAIDGYSYKGYMKPDHIATGGNVHIDFADYYDAFGGWENKIGVPDHKCLRSSILLHKEVIL